MMDCKKVLVETDGDIDKAIELLREKAWLRRPKSRQNSSRGAG